MLRDKWLRTLGQDAAALSICWPPDERCGSHLNEPRSRVDVEKRTMWKVPCDPFDRQAFGQASVAAGLLRVTKQCAHFVDA